MPIDPDQMSHYAVSDLGLHFLHMSHKKYTVLQCKTFTAATS